MIRKILRLFAGSATDQSSAVGKPAQVRPRADKLYPYVVPAEYLEHQPNEPAGISRPLGHGLYVVLVHDLDGLVRNVLQDDLIKLGLTPDQAYSHALGNLETLARNHAIGMTMLPKGPQGRPFILLGGHWNAAGCILLPGLRDLTSKSLGVDDVCVCIPHCGALLAFPKGDDSYRREMVKLIREQESNARKPLTFSLFELSKDGVKELRDEA
jgi:hypothetical protein